MDYRELREVMKFLHCKGLMAKDIYADMLDTLGDSAPSYAMVKKWVTEFKKGRISEDFVRGSGRPRDVSTYENVDFIRNLIKDDERVTVQDIAKYVGISFGSVHTILSKLLELVKVSGRWVPRRVSNERKMTRLEFCKEFLAWHRVNPSRLVWQTVVDDAWLYHFERTDILSQTPGQGDPENGDEPMEPGILNKALTNEKLPSAPNTLNDKKCENGGEVESTTTNNDGNSEEEVLKSIRNDVKREEIDVKKVHPSVLQDDEIGSTESENVGKLEIKEGGNEPDSTKMSGGVEEGSPVVKDEKPEEEVEQLRKKVENPDENSEVSTSEGINLTAKKSDESSSNGSNEKVANGNASNNSVPNILAILGQKPFNGSQSVPGIIPIMGPNGLTLGQMGSINVAQLAALAGMNPLNFAQLASSGLAQMTSPGFAQITLSNSNNSGQKRSNDDPNPLPKKKQRSKRPPTETSCVFWDSEGVIHVETLEPGQKLTGELYCDMLKRLKDLMDLKRPGALDSGVLLLEDQAPTGAKPPRGLQLLPVPVNSPDLSPSDFFIFPKAKEHLRLSRPSVGLNEAIESYIKGQEDGYFKSALSEMERRCTMCVDLNGDYVDK